MGGVTRDARTLRKRGRDKERQMEGLTTKVSEGREDWQKKDAQRLTHVSVDVL